MTSNPETIHSLPALICSGSGQLHGGNIQIRVSDGIACHPMTSGAGRDQQECNIYPVERVNSPLVGWGIHDGAYHYEIGAAKVGSSVLEEFAQRTGLRLSPVAYAADTLAE